MIAAMHTLTEQEEKFLALLQQVDTNSLWGVSITNVLNDPQVWRVRLLIRELKSQAADCGEIMEDILGKDCYKELQNL